MARQKIELSEKQLDQIRVMSGLGMSIERIALILGVSESTLYRRKRLMPEVQAAIDEGLAKAEYTLSKTLFDMAVTDRNLSAIIWWEKTRFGRSDRATIEHEVADDTAPKVLIYLPDNDRADEGVVKAKGKLPEGVG